MGGPQPADAAVWIGNKQEFVMPVLRCFGFFAEGVAKGFKDVIHAFNSLRPNFKPGAKTEKRGLVRLSGCGTLLLFQNPEMDSVKTDMAGLQKVFKHWEKVLTFKEDLQSESGRSLLSIIRNVNYRDKKQFNFSCGRNHVFFVFMLIPIGVKQ